MGWETLGLDAWVTLAIVAVALNLLIFTRISPRCHPSWRLDPVIDNKDSPRPPKPFRGLPTRA